jgi:hypothetical protein
MNSGPVEVVESKGIKISIYSSPARNSPRKLFTDYRQLATPAQAQKWFSVMPTQDGKLVAFAAA